MAWQLTAPSPQQGAKDGAISVAEALGRAKAQLEGMTLVVEGEVSQFKDSPGYKAVYFPVSDGAATMDCMMWRNRYLAGELRLRPGLRVRLTGRFSVYPAKGRMQFEIFKLEEAGEGDLRAKVARLARKLDAEGLMDPARKLPVPAFCERVVVVTSPHGKVKDDVARTLRRRNPLVRLQFCPVQVEGAGAAELMVRALAAAQQARPDAILLVRGGGSYEDLMPFNDEALARAVAASEVPVVTGIGHEPDTTVCDMVSARRCSTPTAAAESVAPDLSELTSSLDALTRRLGSALRISLEGRRHDVELLAARPCLSDPMRTVVEAPARELDLAQDRLMAALPAQVQRARADLDARGAALAASLPARLDREGAALGNQTLRLTHAGTSLLEPWQRGLAVQAGKLEALSPLAVIARGYSMVLDGQGGVVSSVGAVSAGDVVDVRLCDGTLACTVDAITSQERSA